MLAERTFTAADLAAFAELSGDYNPLHTDPVIARRTHFGECVVHGVFLLIWALDRWETEAPTHKGWAKISARFLRPVIAGSAVRLTAEAVKDGRITLSLESGGRTAVQCDLLLAVNAASGIAAVDEMLPPRETATAIALDRLTEASHSLRLHWSAQHGQRLFPALSKIHPASSLALLLAATRIIGMKMPGEHSIFLQLDLTLTPSSAAGGTLNFRRAEYRKSTQRLAVAVTGNAGHGLLWALGRPAPVSQLDMAAVKQHVSARRFAGRNILIVGGSRGLGELAAKILAAGGAKVALTYRLGSDDAARIVADIKRHGGNAEAFQLDTGGEDWEQTLTRHGSGYDHLCYFATPPIVDGDGQNISDSLFAKYAAVYVIGFIQVAQWLARQTAGKFAVFNASSVAAETPPLRNLEYAAAKAAAEACCRWLKVAHPQANIHVARFPRLLTDQTSSFLSAGEHDNLQTVLAELSLWLPV